MTFKKSKLYSSLWASCNKLRGCLDASQYKLSNRKSIFESPALNICSNRAKGDDLLGEPFEFLMRLFAIEYGKSKRDVFTNAPI